MSIIDTLKVITPKPIKKLVHALQRLFIKKYDAELSFWRSRLKIDNGYFQNSFYKRFMLAMAEEKTDDFIKAKIVADFGCGPRGSLVWAGSALLRIGIDVLADRYADEFTDNITSHGMIYLKSTEMVIPLPSDFVDIMFTLNAMDHVNNFLIMGNEIVRVLKPGGEFIGGFNLGEHATPTEPQELYEEVIKKELLNKLEIQSYRITEKGPKEDPYAPFFNGSLSYRPGQEGFLWVRARKPS
jgi:SAM-dependent methyltransferase